MFHTYVWSFVKWACMYGRDMSGRGMCGRGMCGRGMHAFLSYPLIMSGWDISGHAWARQMWAGHVFPLSKP